MLVCIMISRAVFLGGVMSSLVSLGGRHQVVTNDAASLVSDHTRNEAFYSHHAHQIRSDVDRIVRHDPSMAGPLVRLAFHDAATRQPLINNGGGPNGSIQFELEWSENRGLSRPLEVVKSVYKEIRSKLSLADTIALAGAQAVESSGGPNLPIQLGRPDTSHADAEYLVTPLQDATMDGSTITRVLPSPGLDSVGLRRYYARLNLKEDEFVALSGIHGLGRHVSLLNMSKECLKNLTRKCLEEAPVRLPFVTSSVDRFDNGYFQFLLKWYNREVELGDVAFLPTDVALVVDPGLRRVVNTFARDESLYRRTFVRAYQKLVEPPARTRVRF